MKLSERGWVLHRALCDALGVHPVERTNGAGDRYLDWHGTQREVARRLGISGSRYQSVIKRGRVTRLETLSDIADQCPIDLELRYRAGILSFVQVSDGAAENVPDEVDASSGTD